ncbi:hypothetical protein N7445_010664 [Penicillium cf. griseofulvum]|nr:hypothetical protein N7445_010664 [Penicillium cf. griseofulvum]
MLPYKSTSVCDNCRLRRRRCDRIRPKCSFCVSQSVECVYGQATDSQPSQLVQELMSIRERLEFITPLLEPRLQLSARCDNTPPQNCPPLVLKSPHLMQVFGLPSDLPSGLYRLEAAVSRIPASVTQLTCVESTDLTFHRFQDQVHQWYPILNSDFTLHFFQTKAAGFPYSTISCLSLLVTAIASLVDDRPHISHYESALCMMPIAIQECSITSVQCLALFSIYFSCLLQPKPAYDYIQAAFVKIQPFLKSETSMHLNLAGFGKGQRGSALSDHFGDLNALSTSFFFGTRQNNEAYSPNETPQSLFNFCTEVNLQQVLNEYASSATDALGTHEDGAPHSERKANSSHTPGSLPESFSPENDLGFQNIDDPICRAKYHMYEVSIYWPVIYQIILDGFADTELLSHSALFFESVISFLGAAGTALRVCLPKAWFLCASIYTISFTAVRALEVRCLRLLTEPRLWEYLEASVDALRGPSELSPSIQDMRRTLKARMEIFKDQKTG